MSCPSIQTINGNECIGDSLPKINNNFSALSGSVCSLNTKVNTLSAAKANFSVIDSDTIDLSYNSTTGVLSASVSSINSFFTGSNQSLSASGYQKLPGGLIIQWGYVNDQSTTRNFPITFPTNCVSIVGNEVWDAYASGGEPVYVWVVSTSQFRIRQGSIPNNANIYWQAIGY